MTTKKTAAAKTTTTKETKPMTKEEKKAAALAARQKEIDDLKAKYDSPAFESAVNVRSVLRAIYLTEKTGKDKKPAAIYLTDMEHEFLCWYANERGWTNNGFMTGNQVAECHGTIPEGVEGVALYGPTCKTTYYNVDDIDWEKGEPVYDDESEEIYKGREKKRHADNKARAAAREQRQIKKEIADGTRKFPVIINGMQVLMTMAEINAMGVA